MFVHKPKWNLSLLFINQINKIYLSLLLALFFCIVANSQYTGVINANNPGFAETPYSVGSGIYQFESNYFFRNITTEPVFSIPGSSGVNLQFRTSFFYEELEFQGNLGFQRDKIAFSNIFNSHYYQTSLQTFSFGAKYLLYHQDYKDKSKEIRSWKRKMAFDWRRLIPSVSAFAGFNTNLVGDVHQKQSITGRIGFLFQNNIHKNYNIVTNLFFDYIGSNQSETSLVISNTYSLTDRWSTFLEYQNIYREFVNDVNFGTGLAFLYNRNLQINSSVRYLIEGEAKGFYGSIGFSYRLDKHIDEQIDPEVLRNKNNQLDKLQDKKFFGKLIDKINIFSGDASKKKPILSEKTIKSIERNLNKNEKTLYQIRKEKGLPIRTRPIRIRTKPSKQKAINGSNNKQDAKKKKQQEKEDKLKAKQKDREKKIAEKEAKKKKKTENE